MNYLKRILTVALFCLSLFVSAQETQLVYIRIQENIGGGPLYDSYIQISYPDQTSKTIELKKLGLGGKGAEENGKIIQTEVSRLLNQGYDLTSSSTGSGEAISITTIFMTRKEKE